jgi:serine O-acetyltransferase
LLLQSLWSDSLRVSIHPSASIGTRVFLDHATGVLLSTGATILGDVSVGDFARIGAGALVQHDVPARLTNCAEAGLPV